METGHTSVTAANAQGSSGLSPRTTPSMITPSKRRNSESMGLVGMEKGQTKKAHIEWFFGAIILRTVISIKCLRWLFNVRIVQK